MNENGLWSLFWETGLPEAYLMLAALDREGPSEAVPRYIGDTLCI